MENASSAAGGDPRVALESLQAAVSALLGDEEAVTAGVETLQLAISEASIGQLSLVDLSASLLQNTGVGGLVLAPDGSRYVPPVSSPTSDGTSDDDDGEADDADGSLGIGTGGGGLDGRKSMALTIAVGAVSAIIVVALIAGLVAYARHVAAGADREDEEE